MVSPLQTLASGQTLCNPPDRLRGLLEPLRPAGLAVAKEDDCWAVATVDEPLLLARQINVLLENVLGGEGNVAMLGETGSTMDDARWALKPGMRYVLVVAEKQSQGRGRLGRTWTSPPGGLWFTLGIRLPRGELPPVSLAAGLAVAEILDAFTGLAVGVKWPNDLIVSGRKLGGILVENVVGPEELEVYVGVGLNVNNPASQMPKELRNMATSLADELGFRAPRATLLALILPRLATRILGCFEDCGPALEALSSYDILRGRRVRIRLNGETLEGVAEGIDDRGRLKVSTDRGVVSLDSGDVAWADGIVYVTG